jgi:hypothetical protein
MLPMAVSITTSCPLQVFGAVGNPKGCLREDAVWCLQIAVWGDCEDHSWFSMPWLVIWTELGVLSYCKLLN